MDPHFNGLTPAEAERLALLVEEAGEVIQAAGKVLRHGYSAYHPEHDLACNNRMDLEEELEDLLAVILLMKLGGDINIADNVPDLGVRIRDKKRYFHHQDNL